MLKDAWLTATGHKRPGMKQGLSLAEAQARAAELGKQILDFAATGSAKGAAPFPGKRSRWKGFDLYDFEVTGKFAIASADRYEQFGDNMTLIPKPGVGHHPHGLQAPAPIGEFILQYASAKP